MIIYYGSLSSVKYNVSLFIPFYIVNIIWIRKYVEYYSWSNDWTFIGIKLSYSYLFSLLLLLVFILLLLLLLLMFKLFILFIVDVDLFFYNILYCLVPIIIII